MKTPTSTLLLCLASYAPLAEAMVCEPERPDGVLECNVDVVPDGSAVAFRRWTFDPAQKVVSLRLCPSAQQMVADSSKPSTATFAEFRVSHSWGSEFSMLGFSAIEVENEWFLAVDWFPTVSERFTVRTPTNLAQQRTMVAFEPCTSDGSHFQVEIQGASLHLLRGGELVAEYTAMADGTHGHYVADRLRVRPFRWSNANGLIVSTQWSFPPQSVD